MAYDEAHTPWSAWWVAMWAASCAALGALLYAGVAVKTWFTSFLVLFLLPEMIGLLRHGDALPPLTFVTRRYVPRWVPTTVTFAVAAWMLMAWVPDPRTEHPLLVAISIAGMAGWLTNHWDVTYSR